MNSITEILYKNSTDCSDGMLIRFENIQPLIKLLEDFVNNSKIEALNEAALATFPNIKIVKKDER